MKPHPSRHVSWGHISWGAVVLIATVAAAALPAWADDEPRGLRLSLGSGSAWQGAEGGEDAPAFSIVGEVPLNDRLTFGVGVPLVSDPVVNPRDSRQVAFSGRLSYGGDLSALSPGLQGSFQPWVSADALDGPDSTQSRLRLGLNVTPDGGPALSVQGGATALGTDDEDFGARAGLRLKF